MITRLTLTDFMAHAATVLEFAPGLNVLTGPNNTGKSAVVEALRCLAQNPPPRHVIRHGAAEARVTVTLSDGTVVAWVRRPKYALYELTRPGATEPEVFAKFGRTPPEAICDVLRLDLVPLETGPSVDVHIGNQREPVFLLNEPGTAVAGFFAASTEAAHLVAMQNRLTDKVRKAKSESKRLELRLAALVADLDKLAPLPDLEYRLSAGEASEAALAVLDRDIPALERTLADRRGLLARQAAVAHTAQVLAGLSAPPGLLPTAPLAGQIDRLRGFFRETRRVAGRWAALETLETPPALADTAAIARQVGALAQTSQAGQRLSARTRVLARLIPPPELAATAALATTRDRLVRLRADTAGLAATAGRLSALGPPPDLAETGALAKSVAALVAARRALAAKEKALATARQALADGEARIAARLETLGACPLCGARLCLDGFLGTGHDHAVPTEAAP